MDEKNGNSSGNTTRPVPVYDGASGYDSVPLSGGRVGMANENYQNYSEVDRDAPPPRPNK